MPEGAVNFNLDSLDDSVLPDQIPAFDGGQFSNLRANLLQQNQSKLLGNCDIDKLGKLRTRRGTMIVGPSPNPQPDPGVTTQIQGLTSYQTATENYIVAAHNGKLWAWDDPAWVQIGLGGTADGEDILIARVGRINRPYDAGPPVIEAGYPMGTTELEVDTMTGIVAPGEKLYFKNKLRSDPFEYVIADYDAGPPIVITLEEPGLVFDVKDNWEFIVLRPAKVNHPTPGNRYAAAATGLDIEDYDGVVTTGEKFVIVSENINHTISGHSETGGDTTHIDFTSGPALQGNWSADNATVPVIFAQGNDSLFFTDGTGFIYGWTGGIPTSPTAGGGTLMKIGSYSLLDDVGGTTVGQTNTDPPQNVHILLWFQNRLIASGIADEPDAIYFSDFFDPSGWDRNYQKVRIGGGESDPITGLLAWTDYNLIVFKKNSCYIINLDPSQNPVPDDPTILVASFSVKQLHKLIGCPAPWTAQQVGGGSTTPGSDVFFLDSDKKVHSIRRVMAAETQQEVGQAMSLPIQDVLDTINLSYIDKATAMYHNEHYILGFPSTRGAEGGIYNNGAVAYNLLTQSWCGVWSWGPMCFSRRTDLGSYSKLIFGDHDGNVVQWMDDLSLEDETETSYLDRVLSGSGVSYPTQILTRAFTGGDGYSFKTGLNVEFEFDESVAESVLVKVVLDKVIAVDPTTGSDTIAIPFSTLSEPRVRLPITLPFTLPASPSLLRKAFDLQRYGTWRELQFYIVATAGKLAIRSIRLTFFIDSLRLQTIPSTGVLEAPVDLPIFP